MGPSADALGFHSRFATWHRTYASPFAAPEEFIGDVLDAVRAYRPAVVIPVVESTLVLLDEARPALDPLTCLAAPPPAVLGLALDKARTLALADTVGVPTPRTVRGSTAEELLDRAATLPFPVAVKPRGQRHHRATRHAFPFKARYAGDLAALRALLGAHRDDAGALLVQSYVPGVGRCVSAVCRDGEPIAMVAYAREREFPLSGGVSVLRQTIPLDATLARHTTTLLRALRWHGIAMVEFKYDPRPAAYTLMEVNGRFQASTALALDAGVNLPYLVAALHAGWPVPGPSAVPAIGVSERWLRGDLLALRDAFRAGTAARRLGPHLVLPSRMTALRDFLAGFRPGVHYDEFKAYDPAPGWIELRGVLRLAAEWGLGWVADRVRQVLSAAASIVASAPTHRSIRA
jgi:predicted ATP-grasp superfamily ATP-dependent carboligase